jgi:hypothetical protein
MSSDTRRRVICSASTNVSEKPTVSNFRKRRSSEIWRLVCRQVARVQRKRLPSLHYRDWKWKQQTSPECWYLSVSYAAPQPRTSYWLYLLACTCSEVFSSVNMLRWARLVLLVSHSGCLRLLVPGMLVTTHLTKDVYDSAMTSEDDSCSGNRSRPVFPFTTSEMTHY